MATNSRKQNSFVNMSLEDIIQKKRKFRSGTKNPPQITKANSQFGKSALAVTDARLKIIHKKRVQITDAREKLAELAKQKDARLKIEQMRLKRLGTNQANVRDMKFHNQGKQRDGKFHNRAKLPRNINNIERVFTDPSRQVVSQPLSKPKTYPRQIHTNRYAETNNRPRLARGSGGIQRLKPILRTVENDIEIIDDPMGEDYEPPKSLLNRKASLQLKIVAHNDDMWDSRTVGNQRTAFQEKEKSPPRPPSILKKRPMAALRLEKSAEKAEKPALEYRIIVSNLRSSVTSGDIEELFGDVGGMVESRLVRPGTAEVIYKTQEDAQRAVDLYHNRQLDGQPMNCLLVTPRPNTTIPRTSTKPVLYSTNSNVEPDISTFHKVLFSNL